MPTYRINVGLTYPGSGGPGVNVWHARTDSLLTADLDTLLGHLEDFYTALRAFFPVGTVVQCPTEAIKDPYGNPEYSSITGWSVTGTGSGNMLPPANAVCVTWRTTSATRAGRGRTFLPPYIAGASEANGTMTAGALAGVRTAASALVAASEGAGTGAFGVYSRTDGVLRDFIGHSVRDQFAVLRSRRD